MTDVVGQGIARETIGASSGVLKAQGLVRESVSVVTSALHQIVVQGMVREAVVRPHMAASVQQYAVSVS